MTTLPSSGQNGEPRWKMIIIFLVVGVATVVVSVAAWPSLATLIIVGFTVMIAELTAVLIWVTVRSRKP